MSKNLVIVESPAKAKTISKYLGKDFEVMASYGHVRDLVPKEGAVDPDNDFSMKYQVIERSEKHVNAIVRALKKADSLYLATDPDREGEAISWHLIELLREKGALNGKPVHRVVFYEITKNAVQEAVEHPRDISSDLVGAQQARRALDYLFGFSLSPLLWRKVGPKLSAGRVQSPALRMIVERELEIEAFKAREYWSIEADLSKSAQPFMSRLVAYKGDKVEQFSFENEEAAREVEKTLLQAADGKLKTISVTRKQRRRNPAAPFTTSTLQQEASRKLGFNTQRTMRTAQRLYEGIELRRCRGERNTRGDRGALRQGKRSRRAAPVQDQGEECSGSARGRSADLGGSPSGRSQGRARRRPVQAVLADLEANDGLPDGAGGFRYRCDRLRRGAGGGRACLPRKRIRPGRARIHRRVPGGQG
jgi:DNA topoisomerase-1